jgi:ABC-2 type transport system ATP-binding protein/lipopolysaccharide transport system ATP-binding protein
MPMSDNTLSRQAVELSLENVSVSFPIYHGGSRSLKKSLLFRGSGGQLASDANHRIVVEALRDVSVRLTTGDRVALIGKNGAGKTTLLRAMAGIYEPVRGVVKARGRISPMFDISLGIDGDISGYDNIRLRGLILGLSSHEIEQQMSDIVEFTELGDYLDIPVRTYSSGMMTRLTFAVATCFSPEILLMDEWILTGDSEFLVKAQHRVQRFIEQAGILVLASHSEEICRRWCNKAIWIERGQIRLSGDVHEVFDHYNSRTDKGRITPSVDAPHRTLTSGT